MEISKAQLKSWLATIPNGREWLAEKCGVSKSTVDGWCSNRAIPGPVQVILKDLMSLQPVEGRIVVSLSPDEYALVEAAASAGQYATLNTFAHAACMEKAQRMTTVAVTDPADLALLADQPAPYTPRRTKRVG